MAVVTQDDRTKSVRNRYVIKVFGGDFCVVDLLFGMFCWCKGFGIGLSRIFNFLFLIVYTFTLVTYAYHFHEFLNFYGVNVSVYVIKFQSIKIKKCWLVTLAYMGRYQGIYTFTPM